MGLVGREPVGDVVVMEYHNDAYHAWKKRGVRDKVLVHVDGHIDFGWIADEDPAKITSVKDRAELDRLLKQRSLWDFSGTARAKINIANYIYPAMKEGMVRALYWVVPDPVWKNRRQRRAVNDVVTRIASLAPAESRIAGSIFVLPASDLPHFDEPVLLDIDTDYFVTAKVTAPPPYYSAEPVRPWTWPGDFLDLIGRKKIRSDLVTIAYSVEGGYTPLEWRFLGDGLASLIREPGKIGGPEGKRTPELEASCKGPYGNRGLRYFAAGRLNDAVREYSRVLSDDPSNASALTGLGDVLSERRDFQTAGKFYLEAMEIEGDNLRATFGLGRAQSKLGELEAAERSLKKAIELDGAFELAHYELGRVHARQGRIEDAIGEMKIARNGGLDGFQIRFSLARLYRRKGNLYKARSEFLRGLWFLNKQGPSYLLQGLLSMPRMLTRRFRVHQESKNIIEGT